MTKGNTMPEPDPISALATGLNEDAKAARAKGAKAPKTPKVKPEEASAPDADKTVDEQTIQADAAMTEAEAEAVVQPTDLDEQSARERHFERLSNMVADAAFESGTALGDLCDLILDLFKHRRKLWAAMTPSEQSETMRHVEKMAKPILWKIVRVIAEEESDTIAATLDGYSAKDGFKISLKAVADEDTAMALWKMAGHAVVIISADDKRFSSRRRPIPVGQDQVEMAFADDAAPRSAAPKEIVSPPPAAPGDTDLAGEDGDFAVYDEGSDEYLRQDGVSWAPNEEGVRGVWSEEKAKELAAEFEAEPGGLSVVRVAKDAPDEAAS
jgi:hypothetical protein